MPRFDKEATEALFLDPSQPLKWSPCPFCGETLVIGYRKDRPAGTTLTLAHTGIKLPDGSTASACEPFDRISRDARVLALLKSAGARFQDAVG